MTERDSETCPKCGGADICNGPPFYEHDGHAMRSCENCGHEWSELERVRAERDAALADASHQRERAESFAATLLAAQPAREEREALIAELRRRLAWIEDA